MTTTAIPRSSTPKSPRTGAAWVTMSILATLIACYAATLLFVPTVSPPFLQERRVELPLAVIAHLAGGLWALAVGPWQFHARLRARFPALHRWLGRSYVVAILVGGIGALALAPRAQTGAVATVGFALLGVAWIATTILAYQRIRQRDRVAHERWMIRSFALTLAAVTLRFYIPASIMAGIPFETAYPAIAWLCWVPNVLVAEWFLARRARSFARA